MNDDNVRDLKEMRPLGKFDYGLLGAVVFAIVTVIVVNFMTSYGHIYSETLRYSGDNDILGAKLTPIGVDGMLLALALANVFATMRGRGHWLLRTALGFGVAGTVAANGAYGAQWGITGGLLSTWSPVALFVAVEAGLYMFRVVHETTPAKTPVKRGRPVGSTNTRPKRDTYQGTREIAIPQIRGRVDTLNPFEHLQDAG